MDKNILILGDGLLSKTLRDIKIVPFISRKKDDIDIRYPITYLKHLEDVDIVINCIANTDTYSEDKELHWDINYKGVADLVDICNERDIKLVHISTDYVYANSKENASEMDVPVHHNSWYAYTKLLSDAYNELKSHNYLIIRTGHKIYPFPYESATTAIRGNFDYVQNNSKIIWDLIDNDSKGVFNIGSESKTIYDLVYKDNPNIIKMDSLPMDRMPKNVTMNINKLKNELNG